MSFFKNIFSSSNVGQSTENHTGFWKKLESAEDLETALQESAERTVAIFKHSTRCHISKTVLSHFENEVKNSDRDISYYFLDLIAHRDISGKIADDLNVTHQSPQLLIIKDGTVIHHSSHSAISLPNI